MGMRGAIAHVDRDEVTTRHKPTTAEMAPERSAPPATPGGLGRTGRKWWKGYFASPVSQAVADIDLEVARRLARTYDALDALDPVEDTNQWAKLDASARSLEISLGVTPGARARLGISLVAAKKATLASVREDLG